MVTIELKGINIWRHILYSGRKGGRSVKLSTYLHTTPRYVRHLVPTFIQFIFSWRRSKT